MDDSAKRLAMHENRRKYLDEQMAALPEPARVLLANWRPAVEQWGRSHHRGDAVWALTLFVEDLATLTAKPAERVAGTATVGSGY